MCEWEERFFACTGLTRDETAGRAAECETACCIDAMCTAWRYDEDIRPGRGGCTRGRPGSCSRSIGLVSSGGDKVITQALNSSAAAAASSDGSADGGFTLVVVFGAFSVIAVLSCISCAAVAFLTRPSGEERARIADRVVSIFFPPPKSQVAPADGLAEAKRSAAASTNRSAASSASCFSPSTRVSPAEMKRRTDAELSRTLGPATFARSGKLSSPAELAKTAQKAMEDARGELAAASQHIADAASKAADAASKVAPARAAKPTPAQGAFTPPPAMPA